MGRKHSCSHLRGCDRHDWEVSDDFASFSQQGSSVEVGGAAVAPGGPPFVAQISLPNTPAASEVIAVTCASTNSAAGGGTVTPTALELTRARPSALLTVQGVDSGTNVPRAATAFAINCLAVVQRGGVVYGAAGTSVPVAPLHMLNQHVVQPIVADIQVRCRQG